VFAFDLEKLNERKQSMKKSTEPILINFFRYTFMIVLIRVTLPLFLPLRGTLGYYEIGTLLIDRLFVLFWLFFISVYITIYLFLRRITSVFYTLIGLGFFPIILVCLIIRKADISAYQGIMSIIIGIILGLSVLLIECLNFKKKHVVKYQPTQVPSIIGIILLFFSQIYNLVPILSFLAFGGYIFTLGLAFRGYEKRFAEKRIVWSELLTK